MGLVGKMGLGLLILFLSALSLAFLYLNIRKNEISEELLLRVNREFPGEFTVGSISVGDLFAYPNLEIKLNKLQFWESKAGSGKRRNVIIDVPSARFKADLKDVLQNSFRISRVELKDPKLVIERDSNGVQIISKAFQPVRKGKRKDSSQVVVKIDQIFMSGAQVDIIDRPTGVAIPIDIDELEGDFELRDGHVRGAADMLIAGKALMDTLSVVTDDFDVRIKGEYDMDLIKRRLDFKSEETEIGENSFELDLNLDYKDKNLLEVDLNSVKGGLALENLLHADQDSLSDEQPIGFNGNVDFISHFSWEPRPEVSFLESIVLDFSIEGRNLSLKGADLDKFIDNFKRSQNFNLADISAVMFAGPAGLAITKGGDYASLAFASKGDSTQVSRFLAQWRLADGKLETRDVALSTLSSRISVDGRFNMVNDSLGFNFHVLDKKGCELVGQRVYGTSEEIKMGRVNLIKTFLGPVKNFFRNLGMVKCEIVYHGRVVHPETKKKKKSSGNKNKESVNSS